MSYCRNIFFSFLDFFKFNLAVTYGPDDITPLGQDFDSGSQMEKFKNFKFPKSGDGRSFQLQWFNRYDWLEYSVCRDAAFCYVCRQFGEASKDPTFTLNGYNNWQSALTNNKGFVKHDASIAHMNATACYIEKKKRTQSGKSITELLSSSVLDKRRYYCKTIVEVILFLASNRLAMRGDWDEEEKEEGGLFNSLFEFAMNRDPELIASQKHMPPHITYKSPRIQNELISIVAQLLRESIVNEVKKADADAFTILFDGTKDKHGMECVSIAARFILKGKPLEVLLFFESTEDVDALSFTRLLLSSLESYGLDAKKILSQCYDGAAVMNGYKSGVMKRLQEILEKCIPYIHCFNHRLRLVIIETVKKVASVKEFFEQIQMIYTAFKKPKIMKMYEGTAIKRLIDTRWTGHHQATKAVRANYPQIVSTLEKVKDDRFNQLKLDGDDIATCIGILSVMTKKKFVFNLIFMDEILTALAPADAIFQSREMSYHRAMPVIEAVKVTFADYRNADALNNLMEKVNQLISSSVEPADVRPTRNRRRSTFLSEYVVEESIGERPDECDDINSCFYEVIDVSLEEFKHRFTENNDILVALSNAPNMKLDELKPLEKLGITLPPEHEMKTAKTYIDNKRKEWEEASEENKSQFNILSLMFEVKDAFPDVYKFFATVETFACSTAVCEASFSALSRINIPSRLSMTNERMRNLAFIAFEYKRLQNISVNDVLKVFSNKKDRKVQLF